MLMTNLILYADDGLDILYTDDGLNILYADDGLAASNCGIVKVIKQVCDISLLRPYNQLPLCLST